MCNKRPGTRCSPHALEALESAKKNLDAAFKDVKTDRSSRSILLFQDAKKKLEDAQFEYNLSPDGQKILIIQIGGAAKGSEERGNLTKQFGLTQRCIERRKGALQELESPITDVELQQAKRESSRYLQSYTDMSSTPQERASQIGALTKELNDQYEAMSKTLVDHLNKDETPISTREQLIRYMRSNRMVVDYLEKERKKLSQPRSLARV